MQHYLVETLASCATNLYKILQKTQFHYQMQLHLPDTQQNFAVIGQKRTTDRITNGENVLYLDVRMM